MANLQVLATVKDASGLVGSGSAVITTTQGTVTDGSDKAAPGPAQRPTFLAAYPPANWPTWQVAGVHYAVGPKTLPTKNPATISMAGVSVNTTSHIVSVTGSNVTLDGYDFALNGGWQVFCNGSLNTHITNCNFKAGTNVLCPVHGNNATTNIHISYCTIDGGVNVDVTPGTLINTFGAGLTVEYCWLKSSVADIIDASRGGLIDIHNNLIENGGGRPGSHGDWLQLGASVGAADIRVNWNTVYQTNAGQGSQGFMVDSDPPQTVSNVVLSNNTIVTLNITTPGNWATNFIAGIDAADLTGTGLIENNFVDPRGSAAGFLHPSTISPKITVRTNKNLFTGKTINANNSET